MGGNFPRMFRLDEAIAKIQDGTIRDAKTIIGLQMVYGKQQ